MSRYYRALLIGGCLGLLYFGIIVFLDFWWYGQDEDVFGFITAIYNLPGAALLNSSPIPQGLQSNLIFGLFFIALTDFVIGAGIFVLLALSFRSIRKPGL